MIASGGRPQQGQAANNIDGVHPYHQHVNHFQVVGSMFSTASTDHIYRIGEWRDVIPALYVTVRFKPWDFTGTVVLHCHLLEHEDEGIVSTLQKYCLYWCYWYLFLAGSN